MLPRAVHDESGGEIVHNKTDGKTYSTFDGTSREVAMEKYSGDVAKHCASEGKAVTLEARTLKALSKCITFVRVTQQIYGKARKRLNIRYGNRLARRQAS